MPVTTQKSQYVQPVTKPQNGPTNSRAYSEKEPDTGRYMSSSPRARMMKKMTRPHDGVGQDEAGAGLRDGLARAEEEAGADGTADRDHLDLPGPEAPLISLARALARSVGGPRGLIAGRTVSVLVDLR